MKFLSSFDDNIACHVSRSSIDLFAATTAHRCCVASPLLGLTFACETSTRAVILLAALDDNIARHIALCFNLLATTWAWQRFVAFPTLLWFLIKATFAFTGEEESFQSFEVGTCENEKFYRCHDAPPTITMSASISVPALLTGCEQPGHSSSLTEASNVPPALVKSLVEPRPLHALIYLFIYFFKKKTRKCLLVFKNICKVDKIENEKFTDGVPLLPSQSLHATKGNHIF